MNSVTRIRAPHKIHVLSWALALERNGSVACHFKDCQFMALSVEEMGNHYPFCACVSTLMWEITLIGLYFIIKLFCFFLCRKTISILLSVKHAIGVLMQLKNYFCINFIHTPTYRLMKSPGIIKYIICLIKNFLAYHYWY